MEVIPEKEVYERTKPSNNIISMLAEIVHVHYPLLPDKDCERYARTLLLADIRGIEKILGCRKCRIYKENNQQCSINPINSDKRQQYNCEKIDNTNRELLLKILHYVKNHQSQTGGI